MLYIYNWRCVCIVICEFRTTYACFLPDRTFCRSVFSKSRIFTIQHTKGYISAAGAIQAVQSTPAKGNIELHRPQCYFVTVHFRSSQSSVLSSSLFDNLYFTHSLSNEFRSLVFRQSHRHKDTLSIFERTVDQSCMLF